MKIYRNIFQLQTSSSSLNGPGVSATMELNQGALIPTHYQCELQSDTQTVFTFFENARSPGKDISGDNRQSPIYSFSF